MHEYKLDELECRESALRPSRLAGRVAIGDLANRHTGHRAPLTPSSHILYAHRTLPRGRAPGARGAWSIAVTKLMTRAREEGL